MKTLRLGDLADIKLSNVDKKTYPDEHLVKLCNYTDVYRNSSISHRMADDFMVASATKNEIEKFKLKRGQVAITKDSETRDDIGVPAYIADDFHDVLLGYHLALITPLQDKLNGQFLNYYLHTKHARRYFENNTSGSGQRCTIILESIKDIPVTAPEIASQQKIAAVLSALDAKIEVNNRINAELEAMAKTLYDYWFVQFDFPDENGKPYKSSGGKMAFNPDLKRQIPDGWKAGTLTSLANIVGGSTPPKEIPEYFSTKGTAWITPKDLSLNGNNKFISNGETDVTEQGIKKTSLQIMPRGTVLMSSRAPVGYLAISTGKVTTNQGFKSFVPKEGFSTPFLFYTVKNLIPAIKNNSGGSTFKEVSTESLRTIPTPLPDTNLIEKYTNVVLSTFARQELLETENQHLSTLRDWLLPMLMNGQVTVK